jgi:hypothetical protein
MKLLTMPFSQEFYYLLPVRCKKDTIDKWELVLLHHNVLDGISLKNPCGSVTKQHLSVELTACYPVT